jgi:hypothetical protein
MNGMSYDDTIADLRAQARRQRDALEHIVARCDAVNYPPDLVVDIAALACQGLGQPPPGRGAPREPQQSEARA